jgi:hypothetical protein
MRQIYINCAVRSLQITYCLVQTRRKQTTSPKWCHNKMCFRRQVSQRWPSARIHCNKGDVLQFCVSLVTYCKIVRKMLIVFFCSWKNGDFPSASLTADNILDYFFNPSNRFYDVTCDNAQLRMQRSTNISLLWVAEMHGCIKIAHISVTCAAHNTHCTLLARHCSLFVNKSETRPRKVECKFCFLFSWLFPDCSW